MAGINIRVTDRNNIPQLIKNLRDLKRFTVEVGVFGDDDSFYAMIANIHEFGVTIQKASGSIIIPERSFLRTTFDEKQNEWAQFAKRQLKNVLDFKIDARTLYERLGARMVGDIQEKITDIEAPPNVSSTIRKKGSSNPLIDSGDLRRRITYKVVQK
ncbi:phage virion morphogenesis protein [Psychrobacillus faecigallinarum]|uniref:hypothetical protein n=1 Tax=Psychrobacillus faecigallinarum TaxID=2762235 RepID=UPI001CD84746|nr:hypothetical protein [Psychrobacillus faecigallinarum]